MYDQDNVRHYSIATSNEIEQIAAAAATVGWLSREG